MEGGPPGLGVAGGRRCLSIAVSWALAYLDAGEHSGVMKHVRLHQVGPQSGGLRETSLLVLPHPTPRHEMLAGKLV